MTSRPSLPLRPMIFALGFVGLTLVGLLTVYLNDHRIARRARLERSAARLNHLWEGDDSDVAQPLRVATFGTSLLQVGLLGEGVLGEVAADELGVDLRIVKFWQAGGGAEAWHPVLDRVFEQPPHVVIFEDYYLFYRMWWFMDHLRGFRRMCWELLRGEEDRSDSEEKAENGVFARKESPHVLAPVDDVRRRRRMEYRSRALLFGLRPGTEEVIERFHEKGVSVVIVQLPVPDFGEESRLPGRVEFMASELARLEQTGIVTVLRCPLDFEDDEFDDFLHLRRESRPVFSRWLLEEIVSMEQP
jgi:hypothetical protein